MVGAGPPHVRIRSPPNSCKPGYIVEVANGAHTDAPSVATSAPVLALDPCCQHPRAGVRASHLGADVHDVADAVGDAKAMLSMDAVSRWPPPRPTRLAAM